MSSFYGLNKCVQYASLIEIPAAVVQNLYGQTPTLVENFIKWHGIIM